MPRVRYVLEIRSPLLAKEHVPHETAGGGEVMKKACAILFGICLSLQALATDSSFEYTETNGQLTITGYSGNVPSELEIPSTIEGKSVVAIAERAFYEVETLERVTIPESITTIGYGAFADCTNLRYLFFEGAPPDNSGCNYGQTVYGVYPEAYTKEWEDVIDSWDGVWNYLVMCTEVFTPYSGFSYAVSGDQTYITGYNGSIPPDLIIPSTVSGHTITCIGNSAFVSAQIKSVTIPDTVKVVGNYAFQNCSNLTSVVMGAGVASIYWSTVFSGCPRITSITIDTNHPSMISRNGMIMSKKVDCIGYLYNKALTEVTIPDTVLRVNSDAFSECVNLTDVNLSWRENSSVASYVYEALRRSPWYENQSDGLLVLGGWTVGYKGSVPDDGLIIPEGVRGIYNLPTPVASLSIPASVEKIRDEVWFNYGYGLCEVLTVFDCQGVLTVNANNRYYSSANNILFNKSKTRLIYASKGLAGTYTIPSTVTEIASGAFYGCEDLDGLSLAKGQVTLIGERAFENTAWYDAQDDGCVVLGDWAVGYKGEYSETLRIPDGVAYLADGELSREDSYPWNSNYSTSPGDVKTLIFPASIKAFDSDYIYDAFYNLTSIQFLGENPPYVIDNRGVLFSKDKKRLIRAPGGISGSYTIPSTVQVIEDEAFYDCYDLMKVVIPNSVQSIGLWAFAYCCNLYTINLGSGVQHIGYRAFYCTPSWREDDEQDGKIFVVGNWVVGAEGYWDANEDERINNPIIPQNIKGIADGAFTCFDGEEDWNNSSNFDGIYFSSITIPDSVKYVGKYIFADNAELKTIYIPQHLAGYANQLKFGTSATVIIGSNGGGSNGGAGGGSGGGGTGGSMPDTEQPCLKQESFTFETYKDFGVANEYEIFNLQGGKVSLKKIGKSKLPSGVRLKYDKKTGKVVLSGAPSKAGTFDYTFRINEKVGRETREGFETTFKFIVKDMKQVSQSDPNYNPAAGKKIKTDIPIFANNGTFAGLLNVSISTKNAISAKIKGVSKKSLSFKGKWQEVVDGELCAILTTRSGEELELVLKKDGNLCAYLSNITGAYGSELASTEQGVVAVATDDDFARYVTDKAGRIVEVDTPNGPVQVVLKINKKGKVSYKSPTDKSIRGSAQVLLNAYEDGAAQVCLIKTTGRTPYAYMIKLD